MANAKQIHLYSRNSPAPKIEKIRFGVRSFLYSFFGPCAISRFLEEHQEDFCPKVICKILEAPQRLFYDHRMGFYQRSLFIKEHYEWAYRILTDVMCRKIYHLEPVVLAEWHGKTGLIYELCLSLDFIMEKEGCLSLALRERSKGKVIAVAFSFSSVGEKFDQDNLTIKVGCVQSCNEDTANTIRQATKDLYGIQPRIFIIDVLKVLGAIWGARQIEGISSAHHVYDSARYKRKLRISYDELWRFLGFHQGMSGNFYADTSIEVKPLSSYPSRKRSEQSKRRALMADVEQCLMQAFPLRANADRRFIL